jgi:hypothetical protein
MEINKCEGERRGCDILSEGVAQCRLAPPRRRRPPPPPLIYEIIGVHEQDLGLISVLTTEGKYVSFVHGNMDAWDMGRPCPMKFSTQTLGPPSPKALL